MTALLAALPLLAALACLALRVSAPRAAVLSIAVAGVLAATRFRVPGGRLADAGLALAPTLAEVLAILFGGVLLAGVLAATGAQERIAAWIERASAGSGESAALLMVLGLTPFAESVTGFGLGAVVAVPLLLHLGFGPVKAVTLGLMGLFLTAWGALAPGSLVSASLGGVPLHEIGVRSALIAPVPIVATGLTALVVVHGRRVTGAHLGELALASAALWGGLMAINALLGPALGGAIGGLCAAAACLLRFRFVHRVDLAMDRATLRAFTPYAVLVVGLLASTLVVRGLESGGIAVPGVARLLTHGSVWSLVAGVTGMALLGLRGDAARDVVVAAARKWWPVGVATGGFLVLGALLTATGMSAEVARALASMGPAYLFVSSFVAGLGGYIAGSNAGANAMFAASQAQAATQLGVAKGHLLAIQNVGSGVLTIAAPTRVALAVAMVDADAAETTGAANRTLLGLGLVVMVGLGVIGVVAA
ncbi:L-lactate permease [Mariniluteicoccus flavus]